MVPQFFSLVSKRLESFADDDDDNDSYVTWSEFKLARSEDSLGREDLRLLLGLTANQRMKAQLLSPGLVDMYIGKPHKRYKYDRRELQNWDSPLSIM